MYGVAALAEPPVSVIATGNLKARDASAISETENRTLRLTTSEAFMYA